jgi:hypothetical protein
LKDWHPHTPGLPDTSAEAPTRPPSTPSTIKNQSILFVFEMTIW